MIDTTSDKVHKGGKRCLIDWIKHKASLSGRVVTMEEAPQVSFNRSVPSLIFYMFIHSSLTNWNPPASAVGLEMSGRNHSTLSWPVTSYDRTQHTQQSTKTPKTNTGREMAQIKQGYFSDGTTYSSLYLEGNNMDVAQRVRSQFRR